MAVWASSIQACEDGIIATAIGSQTQALHVFYADLGWSWLRVEEGHYFGDESPQRHGARVIGAVHQVRGHIRRDQFDHLDRGAAQLMPERLGVEWIAALVAQ